MIEFDKSEYSLSTVEDGELIAVLSFYEFLTAPEAIAIKDNLLYKDVANGRYIGTSPSNTGKRIVLGERNSDYPSVNQDQRR